ncbi:hypothetical protein B566_EDAN013162 [Ephemera danica]|nr:hypothetical protein B566_EDAN013162 [Ephemera danica]
MPSDGYYTIHTGTDDASLLGLIHEWENKTTLKYWKGPECNQILGTDTTIFPPFLKRESRIDFFISDLCRSLYATYQRDAVYRDIPGYRYIPPQEQLGSVLEQPDNYCWAGPYSGGMTSGLIDLFHCYVQYVDERSYQSGSY